MHVLQSLTELDEAVRRSHERPIIIFKHSLTCGRSAMAEHEVEAFAADHPSAEILMVPIQSGRDVSKEIAVRFRIRHESPQLLVLQRGAVMWHGSHSHVNRREIATAFEAAQAELPYPI
jgi:bacillithiol system protein YtxJ